MPLNIPNTSPDRSGLFEGLLKGHEAKYRQQQLQQQWQEHMQNAALREQEVDRLRQLLPHQIGQYEQQAAMHPFKLKQAEEENKRAPLEYKALEAKIASENARAEALNKFGSQRPSAAVQEALMLFGDPSAPGFAEYVYNRNRMNPQEELTPDISRLKEEGAKSISHLSPAERKTVTERQNKFIDQGEAWKHIMHQLGEADKILDANPDLADSAASVIEEANPKNKGYLNPILNRLTDIDKRTAVQSLDKLYSDIVLSLDAAMPGRGSVFKLQTITSAKGRSRNTNETNKFINESLRREGAPFINYAKDLKKIKGKYDLDFDREKYGRNFDVPLQISNTNAPGGSNGMVEVILGNGEIYDIPLNEVDKFMISHKDQNPQVNLKGGQ